MVLMLAWTTDRVDALAPDAASLSAGHSLAVAKKWSGIGRSDRAIWGLCQGSGKDPYQARVDLSEPAFKCSCPSRKFPCKHGLGLLLLFAKDASIFKTQAEPGWVAEWIAGRAERAEKVKVAAEKPVDAEAQAKRAAQRESRVLDGVATCRVWVEDVVRRGLAAAQSESAATWDRMAARMVDAQASGLARYVRQLPDVIASGAGWDVRALDHLGRLHLLLNAGNRLAELPTDLAGDARTELGWTQSKEDVLAGPGVQDRWMVVGQAQEEEAQLRVRRTWLVGKASRRRALVLDFAAGLAPLDASLVAGSAFDGELAFYPGRLPLRAIVKSRGQSASVDGAVGQAADASIDAGLRSYAEALAANPWIGRWPILLSGVRPVMDHEKWFLVDSRDAGLPLKGSFAGSLPLWQLVSASGAGDVTVLAEWDGFTALPLSVLHEGYYLDLAPRWFA